MTVPPARQCALGSCDREVVAPEQHGGLCERHCSGANSTASDESADSSDFSVKTTGFANGQPNRSGNTRGGRAALEDAVFWFHAQIDRTIDDHTENGEHSNRPTTAREYWENVRGFAPATVDMKTLGWAPANAGDQLLDYLQTRDHDREAMLATGLFTEDLEPLWHGRYVIPYFDANEQVAYAISRTTGSKGGGAVGYDGHPADFMAGKYAKLAHTKEYVDVNEPIYGLSSLTDGEEVLITEGILDAIRAQEAGYACLSPVTTTFKHRHRKALIEILNKRDIETVYVVQDAEPPSSDLDEDGESLDALNIEQFGEGIKGGATTADYLSENGVDARIAELPRPGLDKVDLDDYLHGWADTLGPILASAVPPDQHSACDPAKSDERIIREQVEDGERDRPNPAGIDTDGDQSALFDLGLVDVATVSEGYRGTNPLGHHGESEDYYAVLDGGEIGYDHKHKVAYNALTHLLCETGERRPQAPNGRLEDSEMFVAWRHAKRKGVLPEDDPIPHRAIRYVARQKTEWEGDLVEKEIHDGDTFEGLPTDAYNTALAAVRDEYDLNPGRDPITDWMSGDGKQIIRTTPPQPDRKPFDRKQVWDDLQGPVLDRCLGHDGPSLLTGPQGIGKSNNPQKGLAQRGNSYAVLFPTHQKAHENRLDSTTPEIDLHLKGAGQPRYDCCMTAVVEAGPNETPVCQDHGAFPDMPRMHPVYELDQNHPLREYFEQVVGWRQVRRVTFDLKEQIESVTGVDPTESPWFRQFDEIADAERIGGVFPYATLSSLQEDHTILIDDCEPLIGTTTHKLDPGDLHRLASELDRFADKQPGTTTGARLTSNARSLAEFARKVAAIVATGAGERGLDNLSPPELENISIDHYRGINLQQTDKKELPGETLAQLKVAYGEHILTQIRTDDLDEWNGAVPNLDPLYAAAREAGLEDTPVRRAIAVNWTLEQCPRCRSDLEYTNGRRVCGRCEWDEAEHCLTTQDGERARAHAYVEKVASKRDDNTLTYRSLPTPTDLPDEPLIIGSNASAEPFAGLLGINSDDIHVEELGPFEFENLHHTQSTNGAYHKYTLQQSDFAQSHIQKVIHQTAQVHQRVLYVVRKDLYKEGLFNFPDSDEHDVLTYHSLAGLNRGDFDAVVLIGAPHPDVEDLERIARLLAMDHDELAAGGREYSIRQDTEHVAYRKYDFDDGSGRAKSGRAAATKAFTGITGTLFDARHTGELEQAAHRIRPLLADEGTPKFVYTLTNVATDLPVDELVRVEELTDPLKTFLPVPEGALEFLEYVRDVAKGDSPDGFRPETLITKREDGTLANKAKGYHRLARKCGMDVSERTIYNWIDALEAVGLLNPEEYEQRVGVSYTVDIATLQSALQVLSSNVGFKVAAFRRFRQFVEDADGSLAWLEWAREVLNLGGDRSVWKPPPES